MERLDKKKMEQYLRLEIMIVASADHVSTDGLSEAQSEMVSTVTLTTSMTTGVLMGNQKQK